jgi:hypothetical protein
VLGQIADITKAKAAVVNEKLEWEELDKQEQVFFNYMFAFRARKVFTIESGTKEGRSFSTQE